jgi:anti-sigma factor RsiW
MTELSDDLLIAYVGGDLAPAQGAAIDKVLAQDDVLAERAGTLKDAHSRYERAFDAVLAGAVGDALSTVPAFAPAPVVPRKNGLARIGIGIAAVGVVLGALVAGFGWPWSEQDDPKATASTAIAQRWQDRALAMQSLLSRASVEVSPQSQGNEDLVALQLGQALGGDAKLPNLKAEGFSFVRGQLLSFGDRPLVQLLYLGADKPPLALYAMRAMAGESAGPSYRELGPLAGVTWEEDGIAYLLAGKEDDVTLRRLSETIRNERSPQLGAKAPSGQGVDPIVTGSH